jgi:hypothetical protein
LSVACTFSEFIIALVTMPENSAFIFRLSQCSTLQKIFNIFSLSPCIARESLMQMLEKIRHLFIAAEKCTVFSVSNYTENCVLNCEKNCWNFKHSYPLVSMKGTSVVWPVKVNGNGAICIEKQSSFIALSLHLDTFA